MTVSSEGAAFGSGPYHELEVLRIVEETHDARSVVLAIPEALRELYTYEAGQFLTFRITVDDHPLVRCYSLASCPETESEHKVTVKRVEEGRASNWFHDVLKVGDRLQVMKPAGNFCLADRGTPIVLFAGGSGITPVISLAKTALAKTDRSLLLVYANRDAQSVIFDQELRELEARYGERLQLVHRHDDRDGFLEVEAARSWVTKFAREADFYVCGPGPYMDVVEQALESEGVTADRIFIERFVSPEIEALDQKAPHAESDAGARVIIRLDGAETEVIVGEGETILEAAHRAGLDAPCACLEGYCGACVAQVESGNVEMRLNDGGVDEDQVREGWVLTCQGELRSAKATIVYPDPD